MPFSCSPIVLFCCSRTFFFQNFAFCCRVNTCTDAHNPKVLERVDDEWSDSTHAQTHSISDTNAVAEAGCQIHSAARPFTGTRRGLLYYCCCSCCCCCWPQIASLNYGNQVRGLNFRRRVGRKKVSVDGTTDGVREPLKGKHVFWYCDD